MAWAHGVQTDQAWPRLRAFSAMAFRQRRHRRRRRGALEQLQRKRIVRGSAAGLADGCGPVMAVNGITNP